MPATDVLIAGAGPTGMVLGLWLNKLGVKVRIVDKASGPGTASRALAIQARTLELYRQLGLADRVFAEAHRVEGFNFWSDGQHRARFSLAAMGEGLTPYPCLLIYPQDRHERLLVERLEQAGISIARETELLGFSEAGDHVEATLWRPGGGDQVCEASYIVGCDGANSALRKALGIDFPGGTYAQVFYVADVEGEGPAMNGEIHINFDESDFVAVFGMSFDGRARLIGTVREENEARAHALRFSDVSDRAINSLGIRIEKVNWFSTYRVHHRVASRFRQGRAFLAGDAGHIHSPAGGQGMNTGIGDAINLAWKLAAVIQGRADDRILDSYEDERIGFARRLVGTTDRVFTLASADGHVADLVRRRLMPALMPMLSHVDAAREFLFRTVSQTVLHYRHSQLSAGKAGQVHGGDRLPWVPEAQGDNFDPCSDPAWQVHVYGEADRSLSAWCEANRLPLHLFAWRREHELAGLARDAVYLIRPDGYVALATATGGPEVLDRYFAARGITR